MSTMKEESVDKLMAAMKERVAADARAQVDALEEQMKQQRRRGLIRILISAGLLIAICAVVWLVVSN